MLCKNCKKEIPGKTNFCKYCGAKTVIKEQKRWMYVVGIGILGMLFLIFAIFFTSFPYEDSQCKEFIQKEGDIKSYYNYYGRTSNNFWVADKYDKCDEGWFDDYFELSAIAWDNVELLSRRQTIKLISLYDCEIKRHQMTINDYEELQEKIIILSIFPRRIDSRPKKETAKEIVSNWEEITSQIIERYNLLIEQGGEKQKLIKAYLNYLEADLDYNTFNRKKEVINDTIWEIDDEFPNPRNIVEKVDENKVLIQELKEEAGKN